MNNLRYIYHIGLAFLFINLVACSDSENDSTIDSFDESCTLSIQIGAQGSTQTRAGDDDNALDHEFIHTLCVFIVDANGNIEKKLMTANGTATGELTTGDAYQWRSSEFTLPTGEKTIYAFANWETADNTEWNAIIEKTEGGQLSDTDLAGIVIDNPASNIDFANGKYIPMSVKKEVNLAVSQTVHVELIRLVGRVNVMVNNQKAEDITVTEFTMSNLPDKVALMSGGTATGVQYNQSYSLDNLTISVPTTAAGTDGTEITKFYINEVGSEQTFPISLTTAAHGTFSGTTSSRKIERNQILPLQLNIAENGLNLMINAYIAPIGGYPIAVYADYPLGEDNMEGAVYKATLPEGCSFQVLGTMTSGATTINGTCTLALRSTTESDNIQVDENDKSWAHVTSLEDVETTVLDVSFTSNDGSRTAACQLQVTTEPLKDLDEYTTTTRSMGWLATPLWYEPIQLTIQQGGRK